MAFENFDRQYRLAAGPAGGMGFELGASSGLRGVPLHVDFSFQKSDLKTQNAGKLTVWNLNDAHLSVIQQKDCALSFRAGYGSHLPLIFSGIVSYAKTSLDGADRKTEIEVVDNLASIRDTFVAVSYVGKVNWKTIMDDAAAQMGVAVSYSYNAKFKDIENGFSFVGRASEVLTKGCNCCNLAWSVQNGVLQVKRPNDVMSREVYVISPETGLLGVPARVSIEKSKSTTQTSSEKQLGWEVEYFLNGAINIDDYVKLESKTVTGFFRVHKIEHAGDSGGGDWTSKAELLEVTG